MDQAIRFCEVPGGRVAYATVGAGPPLVVPALWVSHVEHDWEHAEFRAFFGALASRHTVIRYDRLGNGLSDREVQGDEAATLAALVDELGLDAFDVFGISAGGGTALTYAAAHPSRVRSLALFGAFAYGASIGPQPLLDAIVATVRAHWGTGARLLADVWLPGADATLREQFVALQRVSASSEVAASTLESIYTTDVRALLPAVTAPTVVIHRRDDRAIPHALARDLAAGLPNARLVTVPGAMHLPWLDGPAPVLAALEDTLGWPARGEAARGEAPRGEAGRGEAARGDAARDGAAPRDDSPGGATPRDDSPGGATRRGDSPGGVTPRGDSPGGDTALSAREREVLALIGEGLADAEIAARLVLSPHTVHRHVANIRTKLRQPSRAAAAAYAARRGLI